MKTQTLILKEKFLDPVTGEEKLRLGIPTLQISEDVTIIDYHSVQESEQARPDLISKRFYGVTDYYDIILKSNGLSSGFALKEGQLLRIPDKDSAARLYKRIKRAINKERAQFTDTRRMSEQDKSRQEFLKETSSSKKNGSSENLPPNMLKTNQKAKIIDKNKITLGANLNIKKK